MKLIEIIDELDGEGLIVTDGELISKRLAHLGLSEDSEVVPAPHFIDCSQDCESEEMHKLHLAHNKREGIKE